MKLIREIWEDRGKFIFFAVTYGLILLLLIFRILVAGLPWLNDESPPLVWISGITHNQSYRGGLNVRVVAEDTQTSVAAIHVFIDDQLSAFRSGDAASLSDTFFIDTDTLKEGIHLIGVKVSDGSVFTHTSERLYEIIVDRTPPKLTVMSEIRSALQGDTLPLFIQADEALAVLRGEVFDKNIVFFPHPLHPDYFRGLVGIHMLQRPKSFTVVLQASDLAGNEVAVKISISVTAKKFHQEQITLTPQKAGLLTDYTAIRNDYKKINAAYGTVSPRQLWKDTFLRPAVGRISSPFGEQRVFNATIRSIHRGIDIANKAGTHIHAANDGVVVLAEKLHLYGNTVIIDHGQGVLTMYAHMQKLAVTKNIRVEKGQLIGFMGDTGLTTGAHLHWELRVNGLAVNPGQWMETSFAYPDR